MMATPANKSVVKAINIVELVCGAEDGLTLREAATAANLSVAATHRILRTLTTLGAVTVSKHGAYMLGPRLLALHDQNARARQAVQRAIDARLGQMLTGPDMCVRLTVLDEMEVYVIAGADTCANPGRHAPIGARYEAYCNAPGKVLLAALSPRKLDEYVSSGGFVALTARTIVVPTRLAAEFRRVQQSGYAIDSGEFFEGLRAAAVPVRTCDGQVIAALSIAGHGMKLDNCERLVGSLADHARAMADEISRIPGGRRAFQCLCCELRC